MNSMFWILTSLVFVVAIYLVFVRKLPKPNPQSPSSAAPQGDANP